MPQFRDRKVSRKKSQVREFSDFHPIELNTKKAS